MKTLDGQKLSDTLRWETISGKRRCFRKCVFSTSFAFKHFPDMSVSLEKTASNIFIYIQRKNLLKFNKSRFSDGTALRTALF